MASTDLDDLEYLKYVTGDADTDERSDQTSIDYLQDGETYDGTSSTNSDEPNGTLNRVPGELQENIKVNNDNIFLLKAYLEEQDTTISDQATDISTNASAIDSINSKINRGVAKMNGDDELTSFKITHGFSSIPTWFSIIPGSAAAAAYNFYVDADDDDIIAIFNTAPESGTDNVVLLWEAMDPDNSSDLIITSDSDDENGTTVSVSATGSDGSVALTWTVGNSISASTIYVLRGTSQSTTDRSIISTITDSSTTSYTDSSVTNDTEYWYWIKVVTTSGSDYTSASVSVTPSAS